MPVGELAALATACCWAVTSLVFAEAARRIGAVRVNLLRLPLALALLSLALLSQERPLAPLTWLRLGLLSGSAAVGLLLGDLAYFAALRRLGARLSSLLMSLAPVFATLASWLLLGERLGTLGVVGIALTLTGVAWVAAEGAPSVERVVSRRGGIALAVVAAACQGAGLVLAKLGMGSQVAPLSPGYASPRPRCSSGCSPPPPGICGEEKRSWPLVGPGNRCWPAPFSVLF